MEQLDLFWEYGCSLSSVAEEQQWESKRYVMQVRGMVNTKKRGCRSSLLCVSSPEGFRSQLSPCYISPYSQPCCKQVTGTPNRSPATSPA